MRVTIERDIALKLLSRVVGAAGDGKTIPILGNVVFRARGGQLFATASDTTVQISADAPAEVQEQGSITTPARRLTDIVKTLPAGGQIALHHDPAVDPRLTVKCGRSRYQVATLPPEEFPLFKMPTSAEAITVDREVLARLIDKTRFCVSTMETNYALTGVRLHVVDFPGGRSLRAVSTDRHRLACADTAAPIDDAENLPGITVPTKAVDEIRRALDNAETRIHLISDGLLLQVKTGHAELITRLIDAAYPDYQRVIPQHNPNAVAIDAALLEASVSRAALLLDDKSKIARFRFEPGRLTITARSADAGQGSEEIETDYVGAPLELGFNCRYMRETLRQVKGETVTLHLANDPTAAMLATDSADPLSRFVVMPARG